MPGHNQNVDRFLAAHESGSGVYPTDVMDWLASGLREYQKFPVGGLDKAFGLSSVNRCQRIEERGRVLRAHCDAYEVGKSPHAAATDIEINLHVRAANQEAQKVATQYRILFEQIAALGLRMPKYDTIYAEVRKN